MRQARLLGIVAISGGVLVAGDSRSATPDRYEAGNAAIEIDGIRAPLKEASGGSAYADTIRDTQAGPDRVVRKHIGPVKYEPISIMVGGEMPRPIAAWVTDALNLKFTRKNGAILGVDASYKEHSRRSFFNALLSEVTFPELDASSREPKYIGLKISPESTHFASSTGASVAAPAAAGAKTITGSAFRLTIDGLDTSRVTRIEPIDIKMQIAGQTAEGRLFYDGKQPVNLEFPNIVFYVAESRSESIAKWHEDFVVKGMSGQDKEKRGRIEVFGPNLRDVVFTLELAGLGITHFTPEPLATEDRSRRVRVEMYVDQIQFKPGTLAQ